MLFSVIGSKFPLLHIPSTNTKSCRVRRPGQEGARVPAPAGLDPAGSCTPAPLPAAAPPRPPPRSVAEPAPAVAPMQTPTPGLPSLPQTPRRLSTDGGCADSPCSQRWLPIPASPSSPHPPSLTPRLGTCSCPTLGPHFPEQSSSLWTAAKPPAAPICGVPDSGQLTPAD